MSDKIYCIGDSHASFFSGRNGIQANYPQRVENEPFISYRLGAVTAYNLIKENSTSGGREKLYTLISQLEQGSKLLLIFGEIDCRGHLLNPKIRKGRSERTVAQECVEAYMSVVKDIKGRGFDVGVFGPIASTNLGPEKTHQDRLITGQTIDRNIITKYFNGHLSHLCVESGIKYISIFNDLIYSDKNHPRYMKTKSEFYFDHIHLSQKAMRLAMPQIKEVYGI